MYNLTSKIIYIFICTYSVVHKYRYGEKEQLQEYLRTWVGVLVRDTKGSNRGWSCPYPNVSGCPNPWVRCVNYEQASSLVTTTTPAAVITSVTAVAVPSTSSLPRHCVLVHGTEVGGDGDVVHQTCNGGETLACTYRGLGFAVLCISGWMAYMYIVALIGTGVVRGSLERRPPVCLPVV